MHSYFFLTLSFVNSPIGHSLHFHTLFSCKNILTEKYVDKINTVCYYNISNNYYYQKDEENVKV